ncbi:MAG: hypothetical protein Q8Q46_02250 [Candidatus Giovannonibacteria bacterium]|nr:hypothetical protein [Candidatus Giovannonibacteria bacterium]
MNSKKRRQIILNAIRELGGKASTRQIAIATGFDANGVSQSLGAMSGRGLVSMGDYKMGNTEWMLVKIIL